MLIGTRNAGSEFALGPETWNNHHFVYLILNGFSIDLPDMNSKFPLVWESHPNPLLLIPGRFLHRKLPLQFCTEWGEEYTWKRMARLPCLCFFLAPNPKPWSRFPLQLAPQGVAQVQPLFKGKSSSEWRAGVNLKAKHRPSIYQRAHPDCVGFTNTLTWV